MTLTTTLTDEARSVALLQAVGFDRLNDAQRELALGIANRYRLDPMLKHLVMIEGKPYITRDGLLHVAHSSGQLDGIEVTEPVLVDGFWRSTASVYRKDMTHPFKYTGRYPEKGSNVKYAPEMAVKVGEVMALRRAFDVAAPVIEERWDIPEGVAEVQPERPGTLAERVAGRVSSIETPDSVDVVARAFAGDHAVAVGPDGSMTDPVMDGRADRTAETETAEAASAYNADGPDLEEFVAIIKEQGVKAAEVKAVVKRLFPDVKKYDELDAGQLQHVLDELTFDRETATTAPEAEERPVATPEVNGAGVALCNDVSPLSGNLCTLDADHDGTLHRHGVTESWSVRA